MVLKKIKLIIAGLILFLSCTMLYVYKDTIKIKDLKMSGLEKHTKKKDTNPLVKNDVVITSIHMGIGGDSLVGMELASPYNNKKQYSQLWKYSQQIKNDFLLNVDSEQLGQWAKDRNYYAVKQKFMQIVNKYLDEPITNVHLSKFFIE